jgi:hypothetical protein
VEDLKVRRILYPVNQDRIRVKLGDITT